MRDSVIKTIWKSVLAVVCSLFLGAILQILLPLLVGWFLDMKLILFLILVNVIGLPVILYLAPALIFWLSSLFKNKVAGGIFTLLSAIPFALIVVALVMILGDVDEADTVKTLYLLAEFGLPTLWLGGLGIASFFTSEND